MEKINISGIDCLEDYESMKNVVENTKSKKQLEEIEVWIRNTKPKIFKNEQLGEYLEGLEYYVNIRINEILFGLD